MSATCLTSADRQPGAVPLMHWNISVASLNVICSGTRNHRPTSTDPLCCRKVFRSGTVLYHWPMSAHASQAFSIASCTNLEDLPCCHHLLVLALKIFAVVCQLIQHPCLADVDSSSLCWLRGKFISFTWDVGSKSICNIY